MVALVDPVPDLRACVVLLLVVGCFCCFGCSQLHLGCVGAPFVCLHIVAACLLFSFVVLLVTFTCLLPRRVGLLPSFPTGRNC